MNRIICVCMMLASMLLAFGCRSAQVAFPEGNEKTDFTKYDVKGRGVFAVISGKFTIGNVSVDWKRSGITTSGTGTITTSWFGAGKENITTKKTDFYVKTTGSEIASFSGKLFAEAEMEIDTKQHSKTVSTTSTLILKNILKGSFESQEQILDLFIQEINSEKSGTLKGKNIVFEIKSTKSIEGARFGTYNTTGYYIFESGKLLAVVDTMNNGAMYIVKNMTKDKLSAVTILSAALLQYNDPAK